MITINQDKCTSCGVCEMTYPEYFLIEGVSTVVQQPDSAIRVADCCPNEAIEDTCEGCCNCSLCG